MERLWQPLWDTINIATLGTLRSINSLIWALLLVSILGPGILAGILAIGFRLVGFIGKLLYEAIVQAWSIPSPSRFIQFSPARRFHLRK
jgi:phosphonate transport system permease protein